MISLLLSEAVSLQYSVSLEPALCELVVNFLGTWSKGNPAYVSVPTWGNHFAIFEKSGVEARKYRYFHAKTLGLDFDGLMADISAAPSGSIILLHACAHNPTGVDPTPDQWKAIADLCKEHNLIPFFDCAYQGFASGDLEKDAYAIRLFASMGFELLVAQSFAKNFGLYGERIGAFHVLTHTEDRAVAIASQLRLVARPMYSNPPTYGARIVVTVLKDPELYAEWRENLKTMSGRIYQVRQLLFEELKKLQTPGDWSHVINQIGMFTYTGLTEKQVERMVNEFHCHMLKNGRISMAGINTNNVVWLAKAINTVVSETPSNL